MSSEPQASIPGHVCIIMDGNGRWAKKRLMPRSYGHRKGVDATRRAIEFFARNGVRHLTLFAFSSENWQRPADEVNSLMELFVQSLQQYSGELREQQIRLRFIGDRGFFPAQLQNSIREAEEKTAGDYLMSLYIAANYGGRWDIINAARALARRAASGEIEPDDIDERTLEGELSLAGIPDPDLFIRTGSERRISNFLLWQVAYSELYFCDVLWPDFSEKDMRAALDEYARRQRRYGKTAEQMETAGSC
jgi:undecaprenyl diphosphate synthase